MRSLDAKMEFPAEFLPQKMLSVNEVYSWGLKLLVLLSIKWFRRSFFMFTTCFITIGYGYSIYGKSKRPLYSSAVTILVDQVAYFILTLSNFSMAIVLINYEKQRQLINKLVRYIASNSSTHIQFGIFSYILIGIDILCLGLNIYFFISFFGWHYYQYHFFKDFQFSFLNLSIYSIAELFYSVRGMFFDLNQELMTIYIKCVKDNQATTSIDGIDFSATKAATNLNLNKIKIIYLYQTPKYLATLRRLTKKHNELCHLADNLNDYVGIIIFLQIVSIVANIVWSVTVLIEYDIREVSMKKIDPPMISLFCHIGYNVAWALMMMGQTIFIALVGRALTEEGRNTSVYCYKILGNQRFEAKDNDKEEDLIKHQLILLAKQAETRCPVLSAAGFFVVDLEILALVSANVFAFGIVAIQFVLSER